MNLAEARAGLIVGRAECRGLGRVVFVAGIERAAEVQVVECRETSDFRKGRELT